MIPRAMRLIRLVIPLQRICKVHGAVVECCEQIARDWQVEEDFAHVTAASAYTDF
jgi:hypothetical protein